MHRDSRLHRTTPPGPDDPASAPARRNLLLAAALLVLIVLLAYRPSLHAEFVHLDDYQYVVDNDIVRQPSLSGVYRVFAEVLHPSTVAGYYQPLTMISLMLDARLSGATMQSVHPHVFHLTNILLHAATTVLIFHWIRMLVGGLYLPFLVALLFALHPVQVESVAWISQRKTVLATFLAVAALTAYVESVRFRSRWRLAGSVAFYLLATLAKPTVLFLPLVLPLLDVRPLVRHGRPSSRRPLSALRDTLPFAAIMLPMAYVAWSSQSGSEAGLGVPNFSSAGPAVRWVGLLSYNTMLYAGNLLWPMHLSPYRAIPDDLSLSSPVIALSVLGAASLVAVWIASWRFSRPLFCGLTAFGLMLAPALGAIRFMGACVADRFLYFPFFFLLLPIALSLQRLEHRFKHRRAVFYVLLALFVVPMWILMHAQQSVWHDSKSLWAHVVQADPQREQAHANLALIALEEKDYPVALDHAEKAHQLNPESPADMHVLGRAYVRRGLPGKAIPLIEQALTRDLGPNQASGFVALGEARICLGDEAGAHSAVQRASASGYSAAKAYAEVGDAARRFAAQYAVAERWYRKAVDAAPQEAVYRWQLGAALESLGRYDEALRQCEEALGLSSQDEGPVAESLLKGVERIRQLAARSATQPVEK